jgi:hypothetical protein
MFIVSLDFDLLVASLALSHHQTNFPVGLQFPLVLELLAHESAVLAFEFLTVYHFELLLNVQRKLDEYFLFSQFRWVYFV